jgi:D-alanyl-D-alanine carboxypeptidase
MKETMKKSILLTMLILSMLLAACSGGRSTATVEPTVLAAEPTNTAVPTLAPSPTAEKPAAVPPPEEELVMLRANPWQWVAFTNPMEQSAIENPQKYVVTFNDDATVNIVADCNNANGAYTTDGSSITITVGPMTMAACPPASRSDDFIKYLGSAAIYFFEDGNLFIDLFADGGTMEFAPVIGAAGASNLPADLVAQLDAFLQSQVYTEGGNPALAAPGLVLLVDTPDGRYLNAAGVANLDDGSLMQVDDHLQIGSNTKSMTIVLLMQLVEEGLLSLDDPLSKWLPEQAAKLPNGDQITIRQMAQHTAGLWDYADQVIGGGLTDPAKLEQDYTPEELVQIAADNGTPYFAPGEEGKWKYSNTGYVLLGMIVEKITGEKLGDLLQQRIFDPLGMESAVLIEGVPQEGEITTHGYMWTEDGERVDTTNWNASQGWAAGAAAMTAADLATYAKALASGELFQKPETLAEMLVFDPSATFVVGFPYGLGLGDFAGDGTAWGHAGQTLGFQSLWFTDPEKGMRVVGLTNSATYKADAFVNVLNILAGDGALPLGPFTLLPIGDFLTTKWSWTQFVNPVEMTDIDQAAGLSLEIAKDKKVTVNSSDCGVAFGAYTVDGTGTIDFNIDASTLTCVADSLAARFVQHLNDATRWQFANGNLIIELPADGGSLIFEFAPPE